MVEKNPSNAALYRTACGGTIEDPDRYPSAPYQGELVFFCTHGCLKAFESDPDGFMTGKVDHPED